MDIKVGEYVRTKNGYIHKIRKILDYKDNWYTICDIEDYINYKLYDMDIVKHSHNIIDLIEVGDILELREYIDIFKKSEKIGVSDTEMLNDIKEAINGNKTKLISIVTHEMYEANCYRLED